MLGHCNGSYLFAHLFEIRVWYQFKQIHLTFIVLGFCQKDTMLKQNSNNVLPKIFLEDKSNAILSVLTSMPFLHVEQSCDMGKLEVFSLLKCWGAKGKLITFHSACILHTCS